MKRFRIGEDGEMDSISMANVLMLLSRGAGGDGDGEVTDHHRHQQAVGPTGRVFECKTCSRQFPSFQALGGHRASHKKPRLPGDGHGPAQGGMAKPRVHECSICGLEFAIGQALGGHMRRHRATAVDGFEHGLEVKKPGGKRGALWLDLNLPPLEDESERRRKMGFGLQLVDKALMVDCFQ